MGKNEYYRILVDGKVLFDKLGQAEYFARMEDLAIQFYQTGFPSSEQIVTETLTEEN